jgi:hypothetical protein
LCLVGVLVTPGPDPPGRAGGERSVDASRPHEKWGERPKAFVVLKPGATATEEELLDHVRTRIARYKAPREVESVDALPMTSTGKPQKFALRDKEWSGQTSRIKGLSRRGHAELPANAPDLNTLQRVPAGPAASRRRCRRPAPPIDPPGPPRPALQRSARTALRTAHGGVAAGDDVLAMRTREAVHASRCPEVPSIG